MDLALLILSIKFYRVAGARFTDAQIEQILKRTNNKLLAAGIEIKSLGIAEVTDLELSHVSLLNAEKLLKHDAGRKDLVRVFLVQSDVENGYGSWTYEPIEQSGYFGSEFEHWRRAIFITDEFNESTDDRYASLGYQPSNDSLLHELGHVLMQQADHVEMSEDNFFHGDYLKTNDRITAEQVSLMRASDLLTGPANSTHQRPSLLKKLVTKLYRFF